MQHLQQLIVFQEINQSKIKIIDEQQKAMCWAFPVQCCLESLGQHYTRLLLPVQCWPMSNRQLLWWKWPKCCINHTGTTWYKNIVLSSCPNTCETTLHTKITSAMLVQSVQICFWKKITCTMLSTSACVNIAQENCLCNVYP